MQKQDSNKIISIPGQEHHGGHGGVHLCQRCGWPFPKPHPSAKLRRAHKRICGTIEGYKIDSKENPHLNVSDDDDDDHVNTPSPKLVKKTSSERSASIGSNRSDYEVFSDAVQEFSDTGSIVAIEEHSRNVREFSVPIITLLDKESVANESTVVPEDVTVPPSSLMDTKGDEKNVEEKLPVSSGESAKEESEEELENGINVALDFATKENGNNTENIILNPVIINEDFSEHNQNTVLATYNASMNEKDDEKSVVSEREIILSDKLGSIEDQLRIDSEKIDTDSLVIPMEVFESQNPRNTDLLNVGDHEKDATVSNSSSVDIDTSQLVEILKNFDDEDSKNGTEKEEGEKIKTVENQVIKDPLLAPVETCVNVEDDRSGELDDDKSLSRKEPGVVSVADVSIDSLSQTDSLEGNWGSVSGISNLSEVVVKKTDLKEISEPPSFTTLVEPKTGSDPNPDPSKIQAVQNAHPSNSAWFPSLTNVVNDSQGRKKNEEIIEKVKNWSDGKQRTPLKSLLGEAKSESKQKEIISREIISKEIITKNNNGDLVTTVNSILGPDAVDAEGEYRSEIKREKRKVKSRPFWAPFGCCSSVK